jgi:hypothetical protein
VGVFLSGCFLAAARELCQPRRRRGKNIKIAPAIGGALPQKRISFSLFAPFNFLFSETEKKLQCQKNQKLTKICPKKSTSGRSAGLFFSLYNVLFSFFKIQ